MASLFDGPSNLEVSNDARNRVIKGDIASSPASASTAADVTNAEDDNGGGCSWSQSAIDEDIFQGSVI